jgi:hypothetical protein
MRITIIMTTVMIAIAGRIRFSLAPEDGLRVLQG